MSRFNLLANSRPGNGPLWGFVVAPDAKRHLLVVMTDQRPVRLLATWVPDVPGVRRPGVVTLCSAFGHRSPRAVKGRAAVRRER